MVGAHSDLADEVDPPEVLPVAPPEPLLLPELAEPPELADGMLAELTPADVLPDPFALPDEDEPEPALDDSLDFAAASRWSFLPSFP